MNRSISSHHDVVLQTNGTESALSASEDPWLERARTDTHSNVQIWAWEAGLKDESDPWVCQAAAAVRKESPVEQEKGGFENC